MIRWCSMLVKLASKLSSALYELGIVQTMPLLFEFNGASIPTICFLGNNCSTGT